MKGFDFSCLFSFYVFSFRINFISFSRFLDFMIRSLLILSAVVLLLPACKKAEETTSSEDILRSGRWRRTSAKTTYHGVTTDVSMADCLKDNTLEFKVNYRGVEYRNTKCSNGDPDTAPFEWGFANSGKNLRIYNATETFLAISSVNAEVLQLTDNQLSMRYHIFIQDPINQTLDTATIVDVFRR